MKKIYLIGGMLSIFVVLVFVLIIVPIILDSFKKPSLMVATIKLNNLCSVHDDTFMVVTRPYNRKSYFSNGVTRIKVMTDWKVRLAANDKYSQFRYDGDEVDVKKNIELTADCGTSPRLKSIFGAFATILRLRVSLKTPVPTVEAVIEDIAIAPPALKEKCLKIASCAKTKPAIGALKPADIAAATPQPINIPGGSLFEVKLSKNVAIVAPKCTRGPY